MHQLTAIERLMKQAEQGRFVFHRTDLDRLFPEDKPRARETGLARLVRSGWLEKAARSVYVFPQGAVGDGYLLDRIARVLRRGHYNYLSLESALSEWGAISQVPVGHRTIMTTGRKGLFRTRWGTIEFTHTDRAIEDILGHTITPPDRPLRLAEPETAWRDLKRVGRNTGMVDPDELETIIRERRESHGLPVGSESDAP